MHYKLSAIEHWQCCMVDFIQYARMSREGHFNAEEHKRRFQSILISG